MVATWSKPSICKYLFKNGFLSFLQQEKYCDCIVVYQQQQYPCHKIILSSGSPYFMALIDSAGDSNTIFVDRFEDSQNVFPLILQFMYGSPIEITASNVVALKVASNVFLIESLGKAVETFLDFHLTKETCFTILRRAIQVKDNIIVNKCIDFVAKHLDSLFYETQRQIEEFPDEFFFSLIGNSFLQDLSGSTAPSYSVAGHSKSQLVSKLVHEFVQKRRVLENKTLLVQTIDALLHSNTLEPEDATLFLIQCDAHGLKQQAAGCAQVLASNFHNLDNNKFLYDLSASTFCELLRFDELFVKSEDQVYEIATDFISKNSNRLSAQEKKQIMDSIRYTFLSIDTLKALKEKPNPYVDVEEIIDALWARIGRLENSTSSTLTTNSPQQQQEVLKSNLKPRKNRVFTYQSDFDRNGILYWLGTSMGVEKYINPLDRGFVKVEHSANLETGKTSDLISFEPARANLVSRANTTVTLTFTDIVIMPTVYTLRHTLSRDTECLRNWKLQGSHDGVSFVDLIEHVNDTHLSSKGQSHSWTLDPQKVKDYYPILRIIQTGNNSSNNTYLSLSGMELYGLVRKISNTPNNSSNHTIENSTTRKRSTGDHPSTLEDVDEEDAFELFENNSLAYC